jgi:predicted  nucleic acid-binding Zn-ribbon protein
MSAPEQRQMRIQQLDSELAELHQRAAGLQEELEALRSAETAEDRALLARKWWEALRVGLIITLEEFERLLDECRELKHHSPSAACVKFRDRLNVSMPNAAKYVRLL